MQARRILALQGSPRKNGNTARMLGWVAEDLNAAGHELERIDVAALGLQGCSACHLCQKRKDPAELLCTRKDKGLEVFRKMMDADLVLYATPLYWWDFTAQFKPLIDRHLCLVHGTDSESTWFSHLRGKRLALLVTAYDHAGEGNSDLLSDMFKRIAAFCKAEAVAELVVPFCREPKDLGTLHREAARSFTSELITAVSA